MVTIDDLLKMAREQNASDLHLSAGLPPKVRVFGKIKSLDSDRLSPEDIKKLVYGMLPSEREIERFENEGEMDFSYSVQGVGRFRVNAFRQRGSVACTVRLIEENVPRPDALGLPASVVDLCHRRKGLVLVTGPTGSGKSTTLASLIEQINEQYDYHIITLEDPIEYLHKHKRSVVNQREIGIDSRSYSNALRAALREDPDVILVGEMRDLDTISIAVTAAETGHLVFSTLHTIGTSSTIDRIIDVFPAHQQAQIRSQLSFVLEGVVSQQLLPTADGKGRVAAFEVMIANPAIRNIIREGKTAQLDSVIQTGRKQGMIAMDDALLELYRDGKIDLEHALAYARDGVALSERLYH